MNALHQSELQAPRPVRTGAVVAGGSRDLEARLALDDRTRRDAFRLRYQSYSASGFIPKSDAGIFFDDFDAAPNAKTIVVYDRGSPVGSVRACFLSRVQESPSPARLAYPEEMAALVERHGAGIEGICGLEVNRLVRSPAAANNQGLVFLLYRLVGYLALLEDFRFVVSCARRNHVPFYRRLGFQQAAEAKIYPGLTCAMHLLSCKRQDYDDVRALIPMMNPSAGRAGALQGLESGRIVQTRLLQSA